MTIVQSDAHFWNCFIPNDGGDDVLLFDWDCWRVDVGTDDLAYMIAVHWYPDRRSLFERRLLDCFHTALVEHGVEGYDRKALDDDYRLSVLWQIATPVWQANANIPPVIWWNNLERIMLAVDDLDAGIFSDDPRRPALPKATTAADSQRLADYITSSPAIPSNLSASAVAVRER